MAIRKAETFTVPDLLKESDITELVSWQGI